MTRPKQTPSGKTLKTLGIVLVAIAALYAALYPRLRAMNEETDRINRELDRGTGSAPRGPDELARLKSQVDSDPSNAQVRLQYAAKLREAGRITEAEENAQAAVHLLPDQKEPMLLLADIQHTARLYDLAIATYRSILKAYPNDPAACAALGWLYISLGWNEEARDLLADAVKAHPDDVHLQAALSLAYLQATDLSKAEGILAGIRKAHPDDPDLWGPLVDVYLKAKQPAKAAAVATDALGLKPNDPKLLNGLGQAQYEQADYPRAMETFRKVLAADPENLLAHTRLGTCLKAQGDDAGAIKELEYVHSRSPEFEGVAFLLGQLYNRSGRTAEGAKLVEEYRQLQARSQKLNKAGYILASRKPTAEAHYRLALSYREMNDDPHMIAELTRAVELDPHHQAAQKLLTEALERRNRSRSG